MEQLHKANDFLLSKRDWQYYKQVLYWANVERPYRILDPKNYATDKLIYIESV